MTKKTLKIPVFLSGDEREIVLKYQRNQNNVIRFTYNRLLENPDLSTAEVSAMQDSMSNVFIDTHFKGSAIDKAKELIATGNEKVIFGGKKLFFQRCQGKVSREDFEIEKLLPIVRKGQANAKGNSKFEILDSKTILFKPEKKVHVEIELPFLRKKLVKEIEMLKILQDCDQIPITFQLDTKYVYLSYDDELVNVACNYLGKAGRIMAIDLNPNYIGYSIADWTGDDEFCLISSGMFDLTHFSLKGKELKKLKYGLKKEGKDGEDRKQIILKHLKHLNGQRDHEIVEIAIKLSNIFRGFNCSILGIEDLDIKSKDKQKGKNYNRLVNNEWLRNWLVNQLEKRMDRIGARVLKVLPEYSSFIGNLLYRDLNLPDPILSSMEIGRRTYEFNAQYVEKSKKKEKVIVFPNIERARQLLVKPLEGFGIETGSFEDWLGLYGLFKNSKRRYRVTLDTVQKSRDFSTVCIKNKVILYNFG